MSSDASGECRTTSESFVRKNFSTDLSFFSPQASPAEQLQVNEVDHLRDSKFCVCFWRDVEEQWKENLKTGIHGRKDTTIWNFSVREYMFHVKVTFSPLNSCMENTSPLGTSILSLEFTGGE